MLCSGSEESRRLIKVVSCWVVGFESLVKVISRRSFTFGSVPLLWLSQHLEVQSTGQRQHGLPRILELLPIHEQISYTRL